MDKKETMSMLSSSIDNGTFSINDAANQTSARLTCWDYWQNNYYPNVIYTGYPVYVKEKAFDKGKQAFEIIKILRDKKIIKLEKVCDFINVMDELIKIL